MRYRTNIPDLIVQLMKIVTYCLTIIIKKFCHIGPLLPELSEENQNLILLKKNLNAQLLRQNFELYYPLKLWEKYLLKCRLRNILTRLDIFLLIKE